MRSSTLVDNHTVKINRKKVSQVMKFLIVYNHCGLRVTKKVESVKYDFWFSLSF